MCKTDFWITKPSDVLAGAVGYFGVRSSMGRGQRVKVIAEARVDSSRSSRLIKKARPAASFER